MRVLLLAALVAATAACGAYSFPSGSTGGSGTVTGHVLGVPCTPVESAGNPCKGRPEPGIEIDFSSGQGQPTVARTAGDGSYSVELPAGTWTVTVKKSRVVAGPPAVTVKANSTVVADYVVDSGIRVPLPPPN